MIQMRLNEPIVYVEWIDASSRQGWHELKDNDKVMECSSLCWLLHEDNEQIILGAHVARTGEVTDQFSIPKCSITTFLQLQGGRWNKRKWKE